MKTAASPPDSAASWVRSQLEAFIAASPSFSPRVHVIVEGGIEELHRVFGPDVGAGDSPAEIVVNGKTVSVACDKRMPKGDDLVSVSGPDGGRLFYLSPPDLDELGAEIYHTFRIGTLNPQDAEVATRAALCLPTP